MKPLWERDLQRANRARLIGEHERADRAISECLQAAGLIPPHDCGVGDVLTSPRASRPLRLNGLEYPSDSHSFGAVRPESDPSATMFTPQKPHLQARASGTEPASLESFTSWCPSYGHYQH